MTADQMIVANRARLRHELFATWVAGRANVPFCWGSNDCALFAADWVHAARGVDPAFDLRGYNSARQAATVLNSNGGLRAIARRALGAELAPQYAAIGDVVLLDLDGRETLCICNGQTVLGPARLGMVAVPIEGAICAWRVL